MESRHFDDSSRTIIHQKRMGAKTIGTNYISNGEIRLQQHSIPQHEGMRVMQNIYIYEELVVVPLSHTTVPILALVGDSFSSHAHPAEYTLINNFLYTTLTTRGSNRCFCFCCCCGFFFFFKLQFLDNKKKIGK